MGIVITGLAAPVALAVVALIGYLVGHHQRRSRANKMLELNSKLDHTNALIAQVESVSDQLRRSMAAHHSTVMRCRDQIELLSRRHANGSEPAHHMQLQDVLGPTQRLSEDIAHAYDELRQHSRSLQRLRGT